MREYVFQPGIPLGIYVSAPERFDDFQSRGRKCMSKCCRRLRNPWDRARFHRSLRVAGWCHGDDEFRGFALNSEQSRGFLRRKMFNEAHGIGYSVPFSGLEIEHVASVELGRKSQACRPLVCLFYRRDVGVDSGYGVSVGCEIQGGVSFPGPDVQEGIARTQVTAKPPVKLGIELPVLNRSVEPVAFFPPGVIFAPSFCH